MCKGLTHPFALDGRHIPLTWLQRLRMAADGARGMEYLHSDGIQIIHRDFKSLNLLVRARLQ